MTQGVRIPWPLVAGGLSDDAADQGGMSDDESLELSEAAFETPTLLTPRLGSVDGDSLLDDGPTALAAFTGAGSTALKDYVPDSGFGKFDLGGLATGLHVDVTGGHAIVNTSAGATDVAKCENDVAHDLFTAFADITRANDVTAGQTVGFLVRANSTTGATDDHVYIYCIRVSDALVDLFIQRVNQNVSQQNQRIVANFAWAKGTAVRLGCTVAGSTVTLWTQPAGGGAQVDHGNLVLAGVGGDFNDAGHMRFGLKCVEKPHSWDNFTVDGRNPLTSIPFVKEWEEKNLLIVIGHSTIRSKHYLYTVGPDGTGATRFAMPAAYNTALPSDFVGDEWPGGLFFACDTAQAIGMIRFDSAAVTIPLFTLAAGPASPLKPKFLFVHKNQLCLLCYGDEDLTSAPSLFRFSGIGEPDSFIGDDFLNIGTNDEPMEIGISADEYAFLGKDTKWYLLSGAGRQSWAERPLDLVRGVLGPHHALLWERQFQSAMTNQFQGVPTVWFICDQGFGRIDSSGPSVLAVDPVRLGWKGLDKLSNAFVSVDPDHQMVLFGVHDAGSAGEYPGRLIGVDTRTGHWSPRDYGMRGMRGATPSRQVTSAAPLGPPTIEDPTDVGAGFWDSNWLNGDTRAGTTTRHETADMDAAGPFEEDASVAAGVATVHIPGTIPRYTARHYEERVRHERGGLFGNYSLHKTIHTDCTLPAGALSIVLTQTPTPFVDALVTCQFTEVGNDNLLATTQLWRYTNADGPGAAIKVAEIAHGGVSGLFTMTDSPGPFDCYNYYIVTVRAGGYVDSGQSATTSFAVPDRDGFFPLC